MAQESYLPLIWRVIRPFKRRAIAVLALGLADTALASLGVAIVLPLFQALLAPDEALARLGALMPALARVSESALILWLCGATVALFLLKGVVSLASVASSRTFSEQLRVHWIRALGKRYLFARYATLQQSKQGVLLNNWFNESGVAARFFVSYFNYLSALVLAGALILLGLLVNWKAMLVFLGLCLVLVYFLRQRAFGTMARLGQLKVRMHQGINAAMAESLLHVRDLKLLAAEPARIAQIDSRAGDLKKVFVKIGIGSEIPRIVGENLAVAGLMALIAIAVAVFKADPHKLLPLLAFFFVAFYRLMTTSMLAVTARMKSISDLHSVRLMQQLLEETAQLEDRDNGIDVGPLTTDITFERVSFSYERQSVLAELSVTIPRGKVTMLIGPSGAGKSSLLDLLLRLQQPASGRIAANGRDIDEFNLVKWRRCFGYVSQEAALFNGSISSNLRLAAPDASDEQLHAACRLAGAHEFIQAFPNGYETVVGDRGYSVSGGQRKRIAIARALLVEPQVLILDEATTSFEQTLERDILRTLKQSMPHLTVIQVTHRLQSAADADWIIALEAGRLLCSGPWTHVQRTLVAHSMPGAIS